ncbi:MAG: GrpB family protein [Clostridia bacterium]|nr:GrpB family protein [Clostridia bacterium]
MLGLQRDEVKVVKYSKKWAKLYDQEREQIEDFLKRYEFEIEHIGSTSIPGLSAKPIIDIAIAVDNVDVMKQVAEVFRIKGYDLLEQIEDKGEILARKGPEKRRTHYIHIVTLMSDRWIGTNLFKRYLIEHPEYIKQYAVLKKQLAKKFKHDRKSYTAAKNDFIQSVLKLAYKQYRGIDLDEE